MKSNKFIILVTGYNVARYMKKCLDLILCQTYTCYDVIIMDDCSTDGTQDIARKYPFYMVSNKVKQTYPITNFITGIKYFATNPEDIIVFLSADDYLAHDGVLAYLNEQYQDDIWLTYGQFVPLSGKYGPYCKQIPDTRTYRKSGQWLASHLITCKKWLWDKIDNKDLRYKDGEYPNHSFDRAFIYPLVEMAGLKHSKFIDEVLYIYNDLNPASITNSAPEKSIEESKYWMEKQEYKEL
jgi:glycosyltransferase involved in cell wall biosynthesis